ncbi:DUF6364 family protein [Nonomuraea typhae]|uniref:DUF6364 family protein n=1 Tax=Nonomuraea typhae TaxID=2603600 RepID=A0ABW7YYZ3_9ACTN
MNITLSAPEELVEQAREVARQQGTSLNALIRRYLEDLTGSRDQNVAEQFEDLWRSRSGHSGGWTFDREEIYADRFNA